MLLFVLLLIPSLVCSARTSSPLASYQDAVVESFNGINYTPLFKAMHEIDDAGKGDDSPISIPCLSCGVIMNEIEGFLAEGQTEAAVAAEINDRICSKVDGLLWVACQALIARVPEIVTALEKQFDVNAVCIDLSLCTAPLSQPPDLQPIPSFTVSLDSPPHTRWTPICTLPAYQHLYQASISLLQSLLPDGGKAVAELGEAVREYLPEEYRGEVEGCAGGLGVEVGWLVWLNLGYEISDGCTSIVAEGEKGEVLHARNLDFWPGIGLTGALRDAAIQVTFEKGGKPVLFSTTFAGFMGVLSGQRPGAFSVTVNTRFYPEGIQELFYEVIAAITEKNASLVTFLTRDALMAAEDFASGVKMLSDTPLIADVYYTVAGTKSGEGAVISRNRTAAVDTWQLNAANGTWFLVQTNYDHWKSPPWYDDRRTPAINAMNNVGQPFVSIEKMVQEVLTLKPVLNLQTVYSIGSIPAESKYEAWTRACKFPCVQ